MGYSLKKEFAGLSRIRMINLVICLNGQMQHKSSWALPHRLEYMRLISIFLKLFGLRPNLRNRLLKAICFMIPLGIGLGCWSEMLMFRLTS